MPRYLPLLRSLFFHMALRYCLVSFHATLQDSLEHFLWGRSSSHELPQLLYISGCFDLFLTFEGQFCWIWLLAGSFFHLALWIYRPTVFWPSKFLIRNLIEDIIEDPLYVMISFSLAAFNICSLFLAFESLVWVSLNSLYLEFVGLLGCL